MLNAGRVPVAALVSAMLGDSIVSVHRVTNPRGGKASAKTRALLAIGVVGLLASAAAFAASVENARDNRRALELFVAENARPIYDFRPHRMSAGIDFIALSGLLFGSLALSFGLTRLRRELRSPWFRIGSERYVEYPTADAPSPSFPLISPAGDDFVCNVMPGMVVDGRLLDAAAQIPLAEGALLRVGCGRQTFHITCVPDDERPIHGALIASPVLLAFLGGSFLFHTGLLSLLFTIPPDANSLSLGGNEEEELLSILTSKPKETPIVPPANGDSSGGTVGKASAGPTGLMGAPDAPQKTARLAMKDNGVPPQLSRMQAIDRARHDGILGELLRRNGGAFAMVTASADFSSGPDLEDLHGGYNGPPGDQRGFGTGLEGPGPGGGGDSPDTFGPTRYGYIGRDRVPGFDPGGQPIGLPLRNRDSKNPCANNDCVKIGPISSDGIDKEIVRRYIRHKLPTIRACYEKELLADGQLSGTVLAQFQIAPNGNVQGATAAGIGNQVLESCIATAIGGIQFPEPRHGQRVQVRYPFHFHMSGS